MLYCKDASNIVKIKTAHYQNMGNINSIITNIAQRFRNYIKVT
ncbi:hypothetical protein [uncultured Gammaproteobacteria bacterium]|nr:hypothetical protein [uncultured Gammaproteobacteria bacterium]CAC9619940.1 hypothetical protein [uncultured Gammaproteobacteria bacterium]